MKVLCTLLLLLSFCSCKQKQEQKQRDPDDPSNYSLVLDFCEEYTIDPLESFSEDYIPYCYLEIKGKTYDEIVDLFGSPLPQGTYSEKIIKLLDEFNHTYDPDKLHDFLDWLYSENLLREPIESLIENNFDEDLGKLLLN